MSEILHRIIALYGNAVVDDETAEEIAQLKKQYKDTLPTHSSDFDDHDGEIVMGPRRVVRIKHFPDGYRRVESGMVRVTVWPKEWSRMTWDNEEDAYNGTIR